MNIVEAFLELDKLTEETESREWPEVTLTYPDTDFEFEEGSYSMDLEVEVDGWELAYFLAEKGIIQKDDYPDFFEINPEDEEAVDKWLFDHLDNLVDTYETEIYKQYEDSTDYWHAYERSEERAYENWLEYDAEMRATHGRGYDNYYDDWRDN
jgi:hypothetical protein